MKKNANINEVLATTYGNFKEDANTINTAFAKISAEEEELWRLANTFAVQNKISCEEDVYQCDRVAENSLAFIEAVCNIVGYYERDEDE